MNEILLLVQSYLEKANREAAGMSPEILDEAAAAFRAALDRQFNEGPREKFTIRMSNIGRPTCQLLYEQEGIKGEPLSYDIKMKMLFGDMIEVAAIAIMKAAGVNITSQHNKVILPVIVNGSLIDVTGTDDIRVNYDTIYDIKSASQYSFDNKFDQADIKNLQSSDVFGYLSQGFGYAEGAKKRFGGWIAVNKQSGEWAVLETPSGDEYETLRAAAVENITETVSTLITKAPFVRCFTDQPETYYKKPTGNRVLDKACQFCRFKWRCWPGLTYTKKPMSKSDNMFGYYTHIDPKFGCEGKRDD